MQLLRKIGVSAAAMGFCVSLFAAISYAQYRTRTWSRYPGTIYTQPQYRQWRTRDYRAGRLSPWEYRRLQQRRYRQPK